MANKALTLVAVSLFMLMLITGCAAKPVPTEIVIIGTFHGPDEKHPNYTQDTLRDLIVMAKPAAILIEMPVAIGGHPCIENQRVASRFAFEENRACNQAAEKLDVPILQYDRLGRNEYYRQTDYFQRQDRAFPAYMSWATANGKALPAEQKMPPALQLACDYDSICEMELCLQKSAQANVINSQPYDDLVREKTDLMYRRWPALLHRAGKHELAKEFEFFGDEWQTRNQIMAQNILVLAKNYPGQRLVVTCGCAHRYMLRSLFSDKDGIVLREFYQLPQWHGWHTESPQTMPTKQE